VKDISTKSRANYMKERRKTIRNFSVEIDRNKFDKLENKLLEKNITKKEWFNQKIDEELNE